MKIIQAPDQILSQAAKPVEKVDKTIKKLLKDMEQTLISQTDPEGVGLAAPQIGQPLQIFIAKQDEDAQLLIFINPHIVKTIIKPKITKDTSNDDSDSTTSPGEKKKKGEKGVQLEGCLSLKDVWGVVKRPYGVVLSYQDEHGVTHKDTFNGFLATIIQHEMDHLNGILFPKRVLEQKNSLYHSIKNTKGEIEFEEIEI